VASELHTAAPMRMAVVLALAALPALAQFKSTVPLVVSPVTVTDARGHFIDGLAAKDLALYDNGVPQPVQVDIAIHPISLVVAIEANSASISVLDKLGRSGALFTDLLSGDAGETALVTFSDRVAVAQDFTDDSAKLNKVMRNLRAQGDGAAVVDGVAESLRLLATRPPTRRRVILAIGESRDRSSALKIDGLMRRAELQNTAVYWLTYSTLLVPFTDKRKTKWDRMTDEQKEDPRRMRSSKVPSKEEEEPLPMDMAPGSLIQIFTELAHKSKVNAAELLTRTTGGRTFSFVKQSGLESAIEAVGAEVHRQYIVNFQPKADAAGMFHKIRVEVRGRPELLVRAREGYWSVE
jgi:VWFA-related protein